MTTSTQRTVVITGVGAERGIGRATAHRFARDGWAIVGLDLDGDAAEKLASELTERYGVPAFGAAVDTDIRVHGTTPEIEEAIVKSIPLGRQASVVDVTSLFAFLASEEAGYLTGTTQNVNGGSYFS